MPERGKGGFLVIAEVVVDAKLPDEVPGTSQARPRHGREEVVFYLVVESAEDESGPAATADVPGCNDLSRGEAHGGASVDERHALVIWGEAAPEVEREHGLIYRDERHRLR